MVFDCHGWHDQLDMLQLFLDVPIFGIVIEGAVLKLPILNLADAIFRRGRIFVNGF